MKIAMWSGPRNISTALMRAFENRPDTYIIDEPFYAYYLYETKDNHPLREEIISAGEISWDVVVENITGVIPNGRRLWYQKHMAQHNLPGKDLSWIKKMRNVLLIRHPREVILSYIQNMPIKNINQLGYPQQTDLFHKLSKIFDEEPLIIDAKDILKNPKKMLFLLCNKLNISFCEEMLSWPSGHRDTDGIWRKHWYGNVEKSTGFHPYATSKTELPSTYKKIYLECMGHYQQLYQHRMR